MKRYKVIRNIRVALQLILAGGSLAAALGVTATVLGRMQFVPALLCGCLVWLFVLGALTIIFGRFYCSVICPLGAMQDCAGWLGRAVTRRKRRFRYRRGKPSLRVFMLLAVIACTISGVTVALAVFDPWSAFSRMVGVAVRPVAASLAAFVTAGLTFAVIAAMSLRRGRLFCNTLCPVGALLGIMSQKWSFHPDINPDLCVNCGECERVCKAECVDAKTHIVDNSRCVTCFDCMAVCPNGAITYRIGRHRLTMPMLQVAGGKRQMADTAAATESAPVPKVNSGTADHSRRSFIKKIGASGLALFTLPSSLLVLAGEETVTEGGAVDNKAVGSGAESEGLMRQLNPIMPPGFDSRKRFLSRCTGCSACVSACPTSIISLSGTQYGRRNILAATVDIKRGFCLYDCRKCTLVCPSGALEELTVDEKHRNVIGKARIDINDCILYARDEACGECARNCPAKAIVIVETAGGRRAPELIFDRCIGCGKCAWVCPANPKAINIVGTDSNSSIEILSNETIS